MGNLNSRSRYNDLMKLWCRHTQSRHIPMNYILNTMHVLNHSFTHSEFLPCVKLVLRFWVLRRDLAACLSHKVTGATLISFTPADACFTSKKKQQHTKEVGLRPHIACVWGYIGICVCAMEKKHYPGRYETCVSLWCGVREEGLCDQRLLVNPSG